MSVEIFNLVEGLFWIGLGSMVLIRAKGKWENEKGRKRRCRVCSDAPSPAARVLPLDRGRASERCSAALFTDRARVLGLAATLGAFGASDFVEIGSGAWWTPWWLLAWKSACVGVLVLFLIPLIRERRRR